MLGRILLLMVCLLAAGCRSAGPSSLPTQTAPVILAPLIGQPFQLRAGDSAFLQNSDLMLVFERVVQDSRCPADVTCVWSGEAAVALLAIQTGRDPQPLELSTLPEKSKATVFDYIIELRQVAPFPQKAGAVLTASDYVITLVVFSR